MYPTIFCHETFYPSELFEKFEEVGCGRVWKQHKHGIGELRRLLRMDKHGIGAEGVCHCCLYEHGIGAESDKNKLGDSFLEILEYKFLYVKFMIEVACDF